MNASAFDPSDFMPDMMFDDEFVTHFDIDDDGKGPRLLHTDFFNGAKIVATAHLSHSRCGAQISTTISMCKTTFAPR